MLLSRKLPIFAAALTITSIVAASGAGIIIGSSSLERASYQSLSAIADGRRNQIQTYLEKIRTDLEITASRPDIAEATTSFADAWEFVEGDKVEELQNRYIHNNPHPTGQKQKLDDAEKDAYDAVHRMYHASIREVQQRNGYYDVFLINPNGDVIYTVFKELDYATNLNTGQWARTDLANIYRDVIEGADPSKVHFRDFRGYGPSNNAPASFIGKAIVERGTVVGVLVYQMPIDAISKIVDNRTGLGETGETILVNRKGFLLVDSKMTDGEDALKTQVRSDLITLSNDYTSTTGEISGYRGMTSAAATAHVKFDGADWVITALIDRDEALAGVAAMTNWILALAAGLFAISLAFSTWFARSITQPIDSIVARMKLLADGDTSFDLSNDVRQDEIGQITQSLAVFRDAAIEKSRLEQEADEARSAREAEKAAEAEQARETMTALGDGLGRLAQGDMNCRIEAPFLSHFDQLRLDFNEAVGKLAEAVRSVQTSAQSMASGTGQISAASEDLAGQTERNAANLEKTAFALSEIMSTVKKTANGAQQTQVAVSSAKTDAERGGDVALKAVEAMGRIESSSNEIGQIINVIDEIAFQTNLLALNAGVEAARAGEAGKGFAVVASEVRALAQRSADAAKTISELIATSSKEVSEGVNLVGQTGESLDRIVSKVAEINDIVNTIASDAKDQADGLERVNDAVGQMDQATQQNAAMAEQTLAASRSLLGESGQLQDLVQQFELDAKGSDKWRAELRKAAPHMYVRNPRAESASTARARNDDIQGNVPMRKVASIAGGRDWEEF